MSKSYQVLCFYCLEIFSSLPFKLSLSSQKKIKRLFRQFGVLKRELNNTKGLRSGSSFKPFICWVILSKL